MRDLAPAAETLGAVAAVIDSQADFLMAQGDPTIIVLPLTTQVRASKEPQHVTIPARDELEETCLVMPEQPRTLDRNRLIEGPLTRPYGAGTAPRRAEPVLGLLGRKV